MAITDTLSGNISLIARIVLSRESDIAGRDSYALTLSQALTDGSGRHQASIALKGISVSVGTAFTAIDLSTATNPLGTMDDAALSATASVGTAIKILGLINTSTSGVITVGASGTAGLTNIWSTQGSGLLEGDRISPGGMEFKYLPTGSSAIVSGGIRALTINALSAGTTCDILIGLG